MSQPTHGQRARKSVHEAEWDRSERQSTRIALAIALMPIPIAMLIAWAVGSPPWRDRPAQNLEKPPGSTAPAEPSSDHGHG